MVVYSSITIEMLLFKVIRLMVQLHSFLLAVERAKRFGISIYQCRRNVSIVARIEYLLFQNK